MAGMGFPYLLFEGGVGLSEASDLRLSVRALYGLMSEIGVAGRVKFFGSRDDFSMGLSLRLSSSIYQPLRSAVFLSGTRDLGVTATFLASKQLSLGANFFVELGSSVEVDLHPQVEALGGAPRTFELVTNLPIHGGVELALGKHLHFISFVGLDIHLGSRHRNLGEPTVLPFLAVALAVMN